MSLSALNSSAFQESCTSALIPKVKRRRRDTSTSKYIASLLASREQGNAPRPTPVFAATSTEFQLGTLASSSKRIPPSTDYSSLPENHTTHRNNKNDLTRLRSTAFWELHRSVAEGGEVLVRRMRDYETSRARSQVLGKVKEAHKRDCKRLSLSRSKRPASTHVSDTSDSDDIQICSIHNIEDFSTHTLYQRTAGCRSFSTLNARFRSRCLFSSHNKRVCGCGQSEGHLTSNGHTVHVPQKYFTSFSSIPSCSSVELHNSIPLPSSPSISSSDLSMPLVPDPILNSDKDVAAISLALANGACGLNDYADILQSSQDIDNDNTHAGEMWN